MMFCSLECSNINHSRYRAQHYEFGQVHVSGGLELRFLACLQRMNISWSPWDAKDPIHYTTPDGKPHTYTPDFLVGDLVVEVKGWEENPDSTQRHAYEQWDRPQRLVIVNKSLLATLERIFDRDEFLTALETRTTSVL